MNAKTIEEEGARTFALVFDIGDEVCETLMAFSRETHVEFAHLSGIGAFSEATLGFFDWTDKRYQPITIGEQVELVSLIGDIALNDGGEPQLHAHAVVAKRDGSAYGGHLLQARVRPTLELILTESPAHLRRRSDPSTGLALLR